MTIIELLERQPKFPQEDLSETNAAYLSLALANHDLLLRSHALAQGHYPVLAGAHEPLRLASTRMYEDHETIRAIDFGITALESILFLVCADVPSPDQVSLLRNVEALTHDRLATRVERYFRKAYDEIHAEAPLTAKVIEECAARDHGPHINAAVFGAAIARRFELDNTIR